MMSLERPLPTLQARHKNNVVTMTGLVEWTDMCLAMNKDMPLDVAKAIFWMHDKDNTGLMSTEDFGKAMKYALLRATAVTVSVMW